MEKTNKPEEKLEKEIKDYILIKLKKDGYQFPKEILEIFELTNFEFLDKDVEKNYMNWLEDQYSFNKIVYFLSLNDENVLEELKSIIKNDKDYEDIIPSDNFDLDGEYFSINDFAFYKHQLAQ